MPSIDAIEGIGHKNATKLRKTGIRTTESLLKNAATRTERRQLAKRTGLSERRILEWANKADLMRVRGVGEEYSDLLEHSGVDTIKELRRRNPRNLLLTMVDINTRRRLVRRLPTENMVDGWVASAKRLEPVVRH